jgi:hypothetical protein
MPRSADAVGSLTDGGPAHDQARRRALPEACEPKRVANRSLATRGASHVDGTAPDAPIAFAG